MTTRILALCGGVGGAKLARGFECLLADSSGEQAQLDDLTIAVNTGDDFEHLGLYICPDLDTVTYTLGSIVNTETGWGRANESGHCMEALRQFGGEDWFYLGDRDLALHLERTRLLKSGMSLTDISESFARRLDIKARIIPMCDEPAPTTVHTAEGSLAFQHYFVRERCVPVVTSVDYGGANTRANPLLLDTLNLDLMNQSDETGLSAIVICPSNPYLSVDPLLALPGVRESLEKTKVPVIAVSPIVGGQAVKGPTAKIMKELGVEVNSLSIAAHYEGLLDCLVIDEGDRGECEALAQYVPSVAVEKTMMNSDADKVSLAKRLLIIAQNLTGN